MMSKTCPSCGYREPDSQALYCNKCGYPFPRQQQPQRSASAAAPATPAVSRPSPRATKRPTKKKAARGGFLSFGTLVTEKYLKPIYILGALMIVIVSVAGIAGMFAKAGDKEETANAKAPLIDTKAIAEYPAGSPIFWVLFLVAGSVLWRMFCELFALLLRVHGAPEHDDEDDPEPEYEPEDYGSTVPAAQGQAASGQMVECPKCHKIVAMEDLRECGHCGIRGCMHCIRPMGLLKKTLTCRECYEAK